MCYPKFFNPEKLSSDSFTLYYMSKTCVFLQKIVIQILLNKRAYVLFKSEAMDFFTLYFCIVLNTCVFLQIILEKKNFEFFLIS